MSTTELPAHPLTDPHWHPPATHPPVTHRLAAARTGTVLAVTGRGDGPDALTGLADRLALDGYQLLTMAGGAPPDTADRLAEAARQARSGGTPYPGPVLLLGVDTGALAVVTAARRGAPCAGLVLAGMPGDSAHLATEGPAEARVRLRDPAQRAGLSAEGHLGAGELLGDPIPPDEIDALFDDTLSVPTLVLHGDSDPLCPFPLVTRRALRLRRSRIVTVGETAHDVFRDTHRASAIAEVLLFAERLRGGPAAPPPLRALLRSTW